MLGICRKSGEGIRIITPEGTVIHIVVKRDCQNIRTFVDAPKEFTVLRDELFEEARANGIPFKEMSMKKIKGTKKVRS